jgi:hypothetical protein
MVAFLRSMYSIFMIFYLLVLLINSNQFTLFKLCRLLHNRIDPTVELLRKKPQTLKIKRVERYKTTTNEPPIGAPSWCLNQEALEKFNRPTNNIPSYDYDTEESQEHNSSNHNDTEDDNEKRNRANSHKRKRKTKKKSKHERKEKQHKSKKF